MLMGAMSPVTIPAALVQQIAEALSGIALAQLIRPGCPVIFGSFLSNIDMQSGSPTFGTPESAIGLLCTGQIARHFGLPFRTGGGLTSVAAADAQAGYEALMTLLPTFLAGTNWVMHSAGWLEGGLVAGYEKFIIDVELLRDAAGRVHAAGDRRGVAGVRRARGGRPRRPLPRRGSTRWSGSATCFYRPMLSSSENYERWMQATAARTPPPGPARSGARSSRSTRRRRSTTPSAPSSRSTSTRRRARARRLASRAVAPAFRRSGAEAYDREPRRASPGVRRLR